MLAKGQATVAGSLEEADMDKNEALELVKEFGEGVIIKIAERGADVEEFGPLVNGFIAYKECGLEGRHELMDIAIKIVEPDALMEMIKFIMESK